MNVINEVASNDTFVLTDEENQMLRDSFSQIKYDPKGSLSYISEVRAAAYKSFPFRLINHLEQKNRMEFHIVYLKIFRLMKYLAVRLMTQTVETLRMGI